MSTKPRGRPSKHRAFDDLLRSCSDEMRRPKYRDRIGVRKGAKGTTIWVKIQVSNPAIFKGKSYPVGSSIEIKLGYQSSFSWDDAIKERDEYQRRVDHNQPLEDTPVPHFHQYSQDWLGRKRASTKRPDTIKVHLDAHLIPKFGLRQLDEITPAMIERWIVEKQNTGLSNSYIKRMVATLKSLLNDAIREGLLEDNPATKIAPLKGIAGRTRYLNDEEILILLATANQLEPWVTNMIVLALHSGMRRGELQAMIWSDVRSITSLDGSRSQFIVLEDSKSGRGRTIPCTETMVTVLESQRSYQIQGDDRVFPVSTMTWRRRWKKCVELSGLEDIRLHDIRRTNATYAAANGVDLRTLAGRLGHSDLKMLELHYAMLTDSSQMQAAQKIEESFRRIGSRNQLP